MFISLSIIFILGILGGILFEKIKIPKIVYYLILGILLSPSLLPIINEELIALSPFLRQLALCIILTRSGLSLDLSALKKNSKNALLMCFLPASVEIISIAIFAPLILNISFLEALLIGSILAAVSPAIVVPRMIDIIEKKVNKHHLGELVLTGASVDDIYVIILFYSFKAMLQTNTTSLLAFLNIPSSIILGLLIGLIGAFIYIILSKKIKMNINIKVILLLGISFLLIAIETILKEHVSISSMLGVMLMGILIRKDNKENAQEIEKSYKSIWTVFELLLFVLVGISIDLNYAFSLEGLKIVLLVIIGMLCRSIGVFLSLIKTEFSLKEKLYIYFSYLPKATVQASIAGICLSENMAIGTTALVAGIIAILISAPLGALLMDNTKALCTSVNIE